MSDATLKPINALNALSRDIVDDKPDVKAHYPQGSYTLGHDPMDGFSFYANGPSGVDLSIALEATFDYPVFFEERNETNLNDRSTNPGPGCQGCQL